MRVAAEQTRRTLDRPGADRRREKDDAGSGSEAELERDVARRRRRDPDHHRRGEQDRRQPVGRTPAELRDDQQDAHDRRARDRR